MAVTDLSRFSSRPAIADRIRVRAIKMADEAALQLASRSLLDRIEGDAKLPGKIGRPLPKADGFLNVDDLLQ